MFTQKGASRWEMSDGEKRRVHAHAREGWRSMEEILHAVVTHTPRDMALPSPRLLRDHMRSIWYQNAPGIPETATHRHWQSEWVQGEPERPTTLTHNPSAQEATVRAAIYGLLFKGLGRFVYRGKVFEPSEDERMERYHVWVAAVLADLSD